MLSNLMGSIHELNKVNKPFALTERADKAFQKIKKRHFSLPVISFSDFSQLFTLTTDTYDVVCGNILIQEVDNEKKSIIAVASHIFNSTEQNWSTTEWEAYTIKRVILKFDYFLSRPAWVQQCQNTRMARRNLMFVLKFVEVYSNFWVDMLSRGCGHRKVKAQWP